jgi:ribonuclease P/MRP protein subunit RPP40
VENDLLSPAQHGFVPNKSCTTNLLECLDFITAQLVQGHLVDELLLDYEKAFDTVPHKGIVVKLDAYGIEGKIKPWISEFLRGRRQRVVIESHRSSWVQVTSGVPQGSVLEPLLFTIFINDLPDVVKNLTKLYADNNKILAVVNDTTGVSSLKKDLDRVVNWSECWSMRLNEKKCKVNHFGTKVPPQYGYRVNQHVIEGLGGLYIC